MGDTQTGRNVAVRTARLVLVVPDRATAGDLENIVRLNADPQVMACFPRPLTPEESAAWLGRIEEGHRTDGFGVWAVHLRGDSEDTKNSAGLGPFIGIVGLARPRFMPGTVEILWRFLPEFWGRGFATEAARGVLAAALVRDPKVLERVGIEVAPVLRAVFEREALREIVAFTAEVNVRSAALMARLGMTHDPADDFDHPALEEGDRLRRHVLWRMGAFRMRALLNDTLLPH